MKISSHQLRGLIRKVIRENFSILESPRRSNRQNYGYFTGSSEGAPGSAEMIQLYDVGHSPNAFAEKSIKKTYVWNMTGETVKTFTKNIAYIMFKDMLRRHVNDEINARSNPNYEKNDFWENVQLRIEDIEEIDLDGSPRGGTNESSTRERSKLREILSKIITEALTPDEKHLFYDTKLEKRFNRAGEFIDNPNQEAESVSNKKKSPGDWDDIKERALKTYKIDLENRRRSGLEFGNPKSLISKHFVSLASFMKFKKEVLPQLSKRYEDLTNKSALSPEAEVERLYCLEAMKACEIFDKFLKDSLRGFVSKVQRDEEKRLTKKSVDSDDLSLSPKDQELIAFGRKFSSLSGDERSRLALSLGKKHKR